MSPSTSANTALLTAQMAHWSSLPKPASGLKQRIATVRSRLFALCQSWITGAGCARTEIVFLDITCRHNRSFTNCSSTYQEEYDHEVQQVIEQQQGGNDPVSRRPRLCIDHVYLYCEPPSQYGSRIFTGS